ncbi:hypothetical protein M0804_015490 [Polistes exclamans]|nr:hypothetical protein M0804_015490 [Polistes exclamans]
MLNLSRVGLIWDWRDWSPPPLRPSRSLANILATGQETSAHPDGSDDPVATGVTDTEPPPHPEVEEVFADAPTHDL